MMTVARPFTPLQASQCGRRLPFDVVLRVNVGYERSYPRALDLVEQGRFPKRRDHPTRR